MGFVFQLHMIVLMINFIEYSDGKFTSILYAILKIGTLSVNYSVQTANDSLKCSS